MRLRLLGLFVTCLLFSAMSFAQGQGPTQHKVTNTFTQSTTAGITSNCEYRSTTSGGPYTLVGNCSATPVTSFIDATVVGGTTYYYVVTAAVGSTESAYSNEAKAAVPLSPAAPTGLVSSVQ